MYYQYEDEFGNFRPTTQFNSVEVKSLDDLTKSVANDPTLCFTSITHLRKI